MIGFCLGFWVFVVFFFSCFAAYYLFTYSFKFVSLQLFSQFIEIFSHKHRQHRFLTRRMKDSSPLERSPVSLNVARGRRISQLLPALAWYRKQFDNTGEVEHNHTRGLGELCCCTFDGIWSNLFRSLQFGVCGHPQSHQQ